MYSIFVGMMRKTGGLSHVLCGCGGMVDTLVLGASAQRHGGSSPLIRTKECEIW